MILGLGGVDVVVVHVAGAWQRGDMRELSLALVLILSQLRHIRRQDIVQWRYFERIEIFCCSRHCLLLQQRLLIKHVDLKLL